MKQIANDIPPKQISVVEVREAVAAINRGKSEDIFGMSIESIWNSDGYKLRTSRS